MIDEVFKYEKFHRLILFELLKRDWQKWPDKKKIHLDAFEDPFT